MTWTIGWMYIHVLPAWMDKMYGFGRDGKRKRERDGWKEDKFFSQCSVSQHAFFKESEAAGVRLGFWRGIEKLRNMLMKNSYWLPFYSRVDPICLSVLWDFILRKWKVVLLGIHFYKKQPSYCLRTYVRTRLCICYVYFKNAKSFVKSEKPVGVMIAKKYFRVLLPNESCFRFSTTSGIKDCQKNSPTSARKSNEPYSTKRHRSHCYTISKLNSNSFIGTDTCHNL